MSSIIRNVLALSALAAVTVAQDGPAPKTDAVCADVVIVMARGNNAPYNDYRTAPFRDATCGKLKAQGKTCDYIEVVFETMVNGDFCDQIAEGVRNGQAEIIAFNKKCPCTHLVLNGFSQGAWITGDILAGPGGCSQFTTGLDNTVAPGSAIAAAIVWGDVMHTANMPYNVLDGSGLQRGQGRYGSSLDRLNSRYGNVLRSYCQVGDPICADGDNVEKHLNYFELYTEDASNWTVGKINAAAPLCGSTTSTTTGSSSNGSSSNGSGSSGSGSNPSPAGGASNAAPTSAVKVAPFGDSQKYDATCVPKISIEYCYV
ncbi:hypothetical protein ACEQ8H_000820 [Pleosporales sp. CAS-2024a]